MTTSDALQLLDGWASGEIPAGCSNPKNAPVEKKSTLSGKQKDSLWQLASSTVVEEFVATKSILIPR